MRKIALIFTFSFLFISCEKENQDILIGKWKLVKGYSSMGGYYIPNVQDQRMEEYRKDNIRIRYNFEGNEIVRCNYSATKYTVTIYGKELNGDTWSSHYDYWFKHDTLAIKNDGGFEFYNEYFIRVK